jgi:hypothetical protein
MDFLSPLKRETVPTYSLMIQWTNALFADAVSAPNLDTTDEDVVQQLSTPKPIPRSPQTVSNSISVKSQPLLQQDSHLSHLP